MKVSDAIKKLREFNQEKELVVFAEGKIYPLLDVSIFENEVEIDCGWEDMKEKS